MPGHFLFIHVNLLAPVSSPDTIPVSEAHILAHLHNHGFSGEILGDFADAPLKPAVLARALQTETPLAIGFTTYQENIEQVRLWARFAKRIAPATKIVLGGPQVTFMPAAALYHMPEVDFLCRGEGEEVMLGLARALERGEDGTGVPGLCVRGEGGFVETGAAVGSADLDGYASPYLMDLVDLRHKDRVILLTSRGCSYQCAFCYTPRGCGRMVRFYSPERIIDEMKYLKSRGISAFWFADTNFSYSRKRLVALLDAMAAQVPGISFWCQTRYDLMTEEIVRLLRRAGAESVAFGLESANPAVLERIKKPIDLERLASVIAMTQEAGIQVELFSMFALPGETEQQALGTLAYVKNNGVAIEGNSISQQAHLFFGTPLHDDPAAFGVRPFHWTRPAYLSICRDFETEAMSWDEIRRVSLIWRLHRSDVVEDVEAGENLFHRASFITQHEAAFSDQPEALCHLSRIYLALEEYEAAIHCMEALEARFPRDEAVSRFLGRPLTCYTMGEGPVGRGSRVVYDCWGFLGGEALPLASGRHVEAVLGAGWLLRDFEQGLSGMKPGGEAEFEVSFPPGYGRRELAGKRVTFQVRVHFVMEPRVVQGFRALDPQALDNPYPFVDPDSLRQHNINLYYRTVSGVFRRGDLPPLPHAFMLVNLFLKLGLVEKASVLVKRLPENPVAASHLAYIYRLNGQPAAALDFLDRVPRQGAREGLIRAQALFDLGRLEEAEAVAATQGHGNQLPLQELRVQLAERLALPVEVYLEREAALLDMKTRALG